MAQNYISALTTAPEPVRAAKEVLRSHFSQQEISL